MVKPQANPIKGLKGDCGMKNKYVVRGDVTAIIIDSPKYGRKEALISTSKLELMHAYDGTWTANWQESSQTFYVQGRIKIGTYRTAVKLHRLITEARDGFYVDHIDHDGLNNTDNNLRVVTISQNAQNRRSASKNNVTGIRGVSWNKTQKKWHSRIMVNGKAIHIGCFSDISAAESSAKEARRRLMPFSKEGEQASNGVELA